MVPQQNWASGVANGVNGLSDEWMDLSAEINDVNLMFEGMNDFRDPLNLLNITGYVPPPTDMDWNFQ